MAYFKENHINLQSERSFSLMLVPFPAPILSKILWPLFINNTMLAPHNPFLVTPSKKPLRRINVHYRTHDISMSMFHSITRVFIQLIQNSSTNDIRRVKYS